VVEHTNVARQLKFSERNLNIFLQLEVLKNVVTFDRLLQASESLREVHKFASKYKTDISGENKGLIVYRR
jgi:hypothetical protein